MMMGVIGDGTTSSMYDRAIRAVQRALLTHIDDRFDLDAPNKYANVRKLTFGGTHKCDRFVTDALAPFQSGKPKHGIPPVELNVDPGLVTVVREGESTHTVLYSADRDALRLDSVTTSNNNTNTAAPAAPSAPRQYSIVKVKGRADLVVPHEVLVGQVAFERPARKTKKPQNARKPSADGVVAATLFDGNAGDVNLNDSSCSLADSQDCLWVESVGDDVEFDFEPSTVSPFDLYFPPTSQYELKTF